MNALLDHLPPIKQHELRLLTGLLTSFDAVELVLLFGSYARGGWVEDTYTEKGTTYQ